MKDNILTIDEAKELVQKLNYYCDAYYNKAKSLGIPIITEEDFIKMLE